MQMSRHSQWEETVWLLEQQLHLASLAESLADRLSYFNELEAIARLINTPGDAVVLHDRFVPSLTRLDQCLAYVEANVRSWDSAWRSPPFACRTFARVFTVSMPGWLRGRRTPRMQSSFRDAELYKMKFRQCLTRGLTLIKLYVADVLKALLTELTAPGKGQGRAVTMPPYRGLRFRVCALTLPAW